MHEALSIPDFSYKQVRREYAAKKHCCGFFFAVFKELILCKLCEKDFKIFNLLKISFILFYKDMHLL